MFSESGVTSVTPFSVHEHIQRDEADAVILDVDGLAALAGGLVRGLHIDALDQLSQGVGRQLLDAYIGLTCQDVEAQPSQGIGFVAHFVIAKTDMNQIWIIE